MGFAPTCLPLQPKASHGVKPGDVVTCSVLPPPPLEAAPEALPLDIVYEDDHLLVINKVRWQEGNGLGVYAYCCSEQPAQLRLGSERSNHAFPSPLTSPSRRQRTW